MGLDFSHCDARWSYSGFMRFRRRLAALIGLDLDQMYGFGGERSWALIVDPIAGLLNHSDCEGILTPAQCREIAPRLRVLAAALGDDDFGYDRDQALVLAAGMERAADEGENLEFL